MDCNGLRLGSWRDHLILTDAEVIGPWVADRAGWTWTPGRGTAIGLVTDRILAGVVYEDWSGTNVVCHIAAQRLTPKYMRVIFYYPFVQLACRRITAPVVSSNTAARQFVEKLGFEVEATLDQAHRSGDLIIYRMWKEQCKWLSGS